MSEVVFSCIPMAVSVDVVNVTYSKNLAVVDRKIGYQMVYSCIRRTTDKNFVTGVDFVDKKLCDDV